MNVKIKNESKHTLPEYKTKGAAGMDLIANLNKSIILKPLERVLVPTGLYLEIPTGYEAQVRSRSGLALKKGITCLNSPGTIDSDYRGEVGVILANLSSEVFEVNDGERIAQLVVSKHESVIWEEVSSLSDSSRGKEGFGSTGV